MRKIRLLLIVLGPAPIVLSSMWISDAMKSDRSTSWAINDAIARAPNCGAVVAAEIDATAGRPSRPKDDKLERACAAVAERLRKRLDERCNVLVRSPLVIAGDMSQEQLLHWHEHTIDPAQKALANCYFRTPPSEPITVLLFSGEQTYNRWASKLFADKGVSIYGYYKPGQRTLVMNIGTGGGTLVHELTHALMDFDFPNVPDWFNEGLASLHEQCRFRADERGPWIEGLVNWRLAGLQEAIRAERLRSLASLIEDKDFHGRLEGTNYAQARYFCLYMQQHGVLREYFRKFRAESQHDPQGKQTVADVFPEKSWAELDRQFRAWVMTLSR